MFDHFMNLALKGLSKKYVTCLSCEHKLFWQLSRLDDFAINHNCTQKFFNMAVR